MASLVELPRRVADVIRAMVPGINELSDRIEVGNLSPEQWREEMQQLMAQFAQSAAISGAGSRGNPALTRPFVDRLVQVQGVFLDEFLRDILANGWLTSYRARAQIYAGAIKQAYWHADVVRQAGQVLPLPAYPTEGTQCLGYCKCRWRIVTIDAEAGDFDAYWGRHADDSCQTCILREQQWSPVRIRGGILQ